jgi:hypothetical protein
MQSIHCHLGMHSAIEIAFIGMIFWQYQIVRLGNSSRRCCRIPQTALEKKFSTPTCSASGRFLDLFYFILFGFIFFYAVRVSSNFRQGAPRLRILPAVVAHCVMRIRERDVVRIRSYGKPARVRTTECDAEQGHVALPRDAAIVSEFTSTMQALCMKISLCRREENRSNRQRLMPLVFVFNFM